MLNDFQESLLIPTLSLVNDRWEEWFICKMWLPKISGSVSNVTL
jgi:hypothetical protein